MAQYPQPQAVVVQQPGQIVLAQPEEHPASRYTGIFIGVGVAQIFAGIGVSVAIGIWDARYLFSGALYVVAGGLSVATAASPTRCNVIAGMVFSILAAISSCSFVIAFMCILSLFSYGCDTSLVIILFVFCALESVASIVHSAFCCKGSCCQAQQPGTVFIQQPQVAHPVFGHRVHQTAPR